MSKIRSKDTKPEMLLRSALHKKGFRFKINDKNFPGKPDIVLPKYSTVIFVNGCFWHQHKNCIDGRLPKSNKEFWRTKLHNTKKRDKQNIRTIEKSKWNVITIWECEINKNISGILKTLTQELLGH